MKSTLFAAISLVALFGAASAQARQVLPGLPLEAEDLIDLDTPSFHSDVICTAILTPTGETFIAKGSQLSAQQEALNSCRSWKAQNGQDSGRCSLIGCDTLIANF